MWILVALRELLRTQTLFTRFAYSKITAQAESTLLQVKVAFAP
jgi:hypothetical protein